MLTYSAVSTAAEQDHRKEHVVVVARTPTDEILVVATFLLVAVAFTTVIVVASDHGACGCWHSNACAHGTKHTYNGVDLWLMRGATMTAGRKAQVDALVACMAVTSQPPIVVGAHGFHSQYGSHGAHCKKAIHMDRDEEHTSLLVHEYVHYLEDKEYDMALPCAKELWTAAAADNYVNWSTPGDDVAWPFCYGQVGETAVEAIATSNELVAVTAEGYCGYCGPKRTFLNNDDGHGRDLRECLLTLIAPTACNRCPVGRYKDPAGCPSSCAACPAGWQTDVEISAVSCTNATAG